MVKYALGLLDALYTEEELKQSSFVPVGKSTTSVKLPLSPERMKLFEGIEIHLTPMNVCLILQIIL